MHQVLFLLLPAFHMASGSVMPDNALLPNSSAVTTMTHRPDTGMSAEMVVQENESKAPHHNVRMFLIIFGAIGGFLCLSVALFFIHGLLSKRRYYNGGKKKRGGRLALGRLPKGRRESTDSDIWGLTKTRPATTREKGLGAWREGVVPPQGHVYQEVPTEEAGRGYANYAYLPPQYPGPNSLALEERYAPYEGRPSSRDSRGSARSVDARAEPVMPVNVI